MKFYYFKNGKGNVLAKKLLDDYKNYGYQNPVQAIFFGRCKISDLKAGKESLFDLGLEYKKHLRGGKINDELKNAFENEDKEYRLSSEASISEKDEKRWEIKEGKNIKYEIENDNKKLNICRVVDPQAIKFYKWSKNELGDDVYSVIVSDGKYWITKPSGDIYEQTANQFKERIDYDVKDEDIVKITEVKIVSDGFLKEKDVPTILSNMGANQYLVRGTFREIKDKKKHWQLTCT